VARENTPWCARRERGRRERRTRETNESPTSCDVKQRKKDVDFYRGGRLDWCIGRRSHGSYQGGKAVESAVKTWNN